MDLFAATILQSQVRIPNTPSKLFLFKIEFCKIFVFVLRKERKYTKRGRFGPYLKTQIIGIGNDISLREIDQSQFHTLINYCTLIWLDYG